MIATAAPRRKDGLVVAAVVAWLALVAAGMFAVFSYSGRAGPGASAPPTWPDDVDLRRDPGKPILVMLVHPKCPCTRASLTELAQVATRTEGKARLHVLFMRPDGFGDEWARSDAYRRAASITGVEVSLDPGGHLGRRLGATTSGHVVVYDAEGRLRFSGGITSARGHEGDNAGRQLAITVLGGPRHEDAKFVMTHDDGRVVVAGAHMDVIILRGATGKCELVPTSGTWIGLVEDVSSHNQETTFQLEDGDTLVLYTDGLTEAGADATEAFGLDRLCAVIESTASESPEGIREAVLHAVARWSKRQVDDITMLVARRHGQRRAAAA